MMIAFEVWLNGGKLCVAGVGEHGVLNQTLTWAAGRPEDRPVDYPKWAPTISLHVGGLVSGEFVDWLDHPIVSPGDEVIVRVVEVETIDEPIRKDPGEDRKLFLNRVKHQLTVVKGLLPSPVVEGSYLDSIQGLDELLFRDELKMAVKVLGVLGELNNCPPTFWTELLPAALDLNLYDRATIYRQRAN